MFHEPRSARTADADVVSTEVDIQAPRIACPPNAMPSPMRPAHYVASIDDGGAIIASQYTIIGDR
jgi:hypothetical protein